MINIFKVRILKIFILSIPISIVIMEDIFSPMANQVIYIL